MRTYGKVEFRTSHLHPGIKFWAVTAEPHVMIKLKAVLRRVNPGQFGTVTIQHSDEVCRDLEWFMERYPLENLSPKELKAGADAYRARLERLEAIHLRGIEGLSFPLAEPARGYQMESAAVFLEQGALLLADELGVGKSITALAALTDQRTRPALVVAYPHLLEQWKRYAARFMPGAKVHIIKKGTVYDLPPADIYLTTYHKLAGWAEVLNKFIRCVVFDEVQELRHTGTKKYSAAEHIRGGAAFCLGLSATPIYNYGGEIHNVMEVISPGTLGNANEFFREWCLPVGDGQYKLKDPDAFGAYLRDHHLMIRRTRKEVGRELPPMETIVHTVEYEARVLRNLDAEATELAHRILSEATTFHEKGEAAREFDARLRQATGIAKAPHVAAFVKLLVESGEKVVLTGWHRAVYEVWREFLGMPVSMYTGTESPNEKQRQVDNFIEGKTQVFVMSLRSGAGLDGLQKVCSTVVHGELDWSKAVHEQCGGRLFRDGQENTVAEYYLVSDAGSDPVIMDVLGLKADQLRGLLSPGSGGLVLGNDDGQRVKRLAENYLASRKRKGELAL